MIALGIDVGRYGALALVKSHGSGMSELLDVADMPTMPLAKNGKVKHRVSGSLLWADLVAAKDRHGKIDVCVVEEVSSSPQMGTTSSFEFGYSLGITVGIISCLGVPIVFSSPARWKKDMRLGSDKDLSREMASRVWPDSAEIFRRKKDDGRAEAALLALWHIQRGVHL